MKSLLVIIVLLLPSIPSWASGRIVGNGGDVLVCPQSIELLDHYEARAIRGIPINFDVEGPSVSERVERALSRLARVSPERARRYLEWARTFYSEAQFLSDIELVDIPDSQHIAIPKGCSIRQIANQSGLLLPGQKRYTVDNDLWQQLNEDQKAGLILHEIAYREAIELGHSDSIAVRWLSSLMASPVIDQLSVGEFIELLVFLNYPTVRVQGAMLELYHWKNGAKVRHSTNFFKNGVLAFGRVAQNSLLYTGGRAVSVRGPISFFDNGQVETTYLAVGQKMKIGLVDFEFAPQILRFHKNGSFALGVLSAPVEIVIGAVRIVVNGHLEYFENGTLHRAKIERGVWRGGYGELKIYQAAEFYDSGVPKFLHVGHGKISVLGSRVSVSGEMFLYPEGNIQRIYLSGMENRLPMQSVLINVSSLAPVDFYRSGQLYKATLQKNTFLKVVSGERRLFLSGDELLFAEGGRVRSFQR